MNNLTDLFVDNIFNLTKSPFSKKVIDQAKNCVIDYLGVTIAGAALFNEKIHNLVDSLGSTHNDVTLIGLSKKSTLNNAILVNGISAHVAELDDGDRVGMLHPGAVIISTLFPLAEYEDLSGQDLILGIIVGYEAAVRIARAIQPSHKARGFHATSTCGTIGAALGASAALGLTRSQMKVAFSSAVTSASGFLKTTENGSQLKPYNVGRAALCGFLAASLARAGFEGPQDVLNGTQGFFSLMSDKCDLSMLFQKSGELLCIEQIYRKLYAACRHAHPAIAAALKIRVEHNVLPETIQSVTVRTYRWAISGHDHTDIINASSAMMSIPFSVAIALQTGLTGIDAYTEKNIRNVNILSLANKIKVIEEKSLTELVPNKRSAIVEITTGENKKFVEQVDFPKGEPENPLTEDELQEKFYSLVSFGKKDESVASELLMKVRNLDDNLSDLFRLLSLL